jgi:hypothetical protein
MIAALDTSVQLPRKEQTGTRPRVPSDASRDLKKRAIRVAKTRDLIFPLIDLHSDMENQYWQSFNCCRDLIQEGQYITSKYCNKRWCFQCNAIRAAKMIEGYKPVFEKWKGVQFVTLTRPNVPGDQLLTEVEDLIHTFELVRRFMRERRKMNIKGLRKLEVTYNNKTNTYHPHFHLIVDSLQTSKLIIAEWLYRNPKASPDAQHTRPADDGCYVEMFKYATKEIVKPHTPPRAKDLIFKSITGKRIYQAFGVKKVVSEDVAELERQGYSMLSPCSYRQWTFSDKQNDWFDPRGRSLIEAVQYETLFRPLVLHINSS